MSDPPELADSRRNKRQRGRERKRCGGRTLWMKFVYYDKEGGKCSVAEVVTIYFIIFSQLIISVSSFPSFNSMYLRSNLKCKSTL